MDGLLAQTWEMLWGRSTGPLTLRLILQPTMAIFLAVRAGLRDAKTNQGPFLWSAINRPEMRKQLLGQAWKDIGKLLVMAVLLDVVYQVFVFRWVYPLQAVVMATVLAVVPYSIVRGPVSRIAAWSKSGGSPKP